MSTLRKDPLTHGWVIFADDRFQPPSGRSERETSTLSPENCPFCPGNEHLTPPEIRAVRPNGGAPNSAGWSVRTIPNQFAALHIEGKFERRGEGLYDMMNGVGAHEVVIEGPDHMARFADYSLDRVQHILTTYRDRVADLVKDTRFRYVQVFRNYGEAAGQSIMHPHSQIIALPILPRWVREEIQQAYEYYLIKERCIFCDIIAQDTDGPRMVTQNDHFVALEPFASKFPFETWIYPKDHQSYFHTLPDDHLADLAEIVRTTLRALTLAIGDPPYNLIIHPAPMNPERSYHNNRAKVTDYYHWHIEIIPRATKVAGFEYGTGFYINPVYPESAAEYLRNMVAELRQRAKSRTPHVDSAAAKRQ